VDILTPLFKSGRARMLYSRLAGLPILGRGVHAIAHTVVPPNSKRWVRIPAGFAEGMWVYLDPASNVGAFHGDHEPWVQDLLKQWLHPDVTFYDVGAHVGVFALGAARITKKVLAFEPDENNIESLRAEIGRNKLKGIRVVAAAAWHSRGTVLFQGSGFLGTVAEDGREVPAVMLDDFFMEGPKVVKIDTEGGELSVLRGAKRLLEGDSKWIIEAHAAEHVDVLGDLLEHHDYVVDVLTPKHEHYSDYRQTYVVASRK
jgi:FkbM family methyltransferase